ncbi:MAG: single-stranded DNA-binding protein [Acidimicrobiia bacterium]|nr:single-stranded DNA-binding protein [Acidimicrobiia bacterium]
MDLNLVILCGRLVSPPDHRTVESGANIVRFLLAIRSETPQNRVDVLPVMFWDPPPGALDVAVGHTVWVAGRILRRFPEVGSTRGSRLELVADHVDTRPDRPLEMSSV